MLNTLFIEQKTAKLLRFINFFSFFPILLKTSSHFYYKSNKLVVKLADKKKILVTSALPYVNNVPHLGTMVCVLSADVYTRFLRLNKDIEVVSILGTDENGI